MNSHDLDTDLIEPPAKKNRIKESTTSSNDGMLQQIFFKFFLITFSIIFAINFLYLFFFLKIFVPTRNYVENGPPGSEQLNRILIFLSFQ